MFRKRKFGNTTFHSQLARNVDNQRERNMRVVVFGSINIDAKRLVPVALDGSFGAWKRVDGIAFD